MTTLIAGFGKSGRAIYEAAQRLGIGTAVWDDNPAVLAGAREMGVTVLDRLDHLRADEIVLSPGVKPSHPLLKEAARREIPSLTEVEWAGGRINAEIIGVTGTNGKSTTVHLIAALLETIDPTVQEAGNIGVPLSHFVGREGIPHTIVCELSSYQIALSHALHLAAGVILPITPDHLAWHGSFEAYRDAKLKLAGWVGKKKRVVAHESLALPGVLTYGASPACDMTADPESLLYHGAPLFARGDFPLLGDHNWENAAAAVLTALAMGLPEASVPPALTRVEPLPHRMEIVAETNGVTWIDDSKGTNVDAVIKALTAFDAPVVHLILGGTGKGSSYAPLIDPIRRVCRSVVCMGEEGPRIFGELEGSFDAIHLVKTLPEAVALLRTLVEPGETVLLSPACASFDHYTSFEERGDHFRELVT